MVWFPVRHYLLILDCGQSHRAYLLCLSHLQQIAQIAFPDCCWLPRSILRCTDDMMAEVLPSPKSCHAQTRNFTTLISTFRFLQYAITLPLPNRELLCAKMSRAARDAEHLLSKGRELEYSSSRLCALANTAESEKGSRKSLIIKPVVITALQRNDTSSSGDWRYNSAPSSNDTCYTSDQKGQGFRNSTCPELKEWASKPLKMRALANRDLSGYTLVLLQPQKK